MASTLTNYQATYDLSEIDIRNIEFLEQHTGHHKATVVHQALYFCQMSLRMKQQGKYTSIMYKSGGGRGTTASINHGDVANAYNNRPQNAQPVKLLINRNTDALQAMHDIKNAIKASSDSVAVAYALEYAATTVRRMQNCNNGKYARVFFSYNNRPNEGGTILTKHPYDMTLPNKFRKAGRKVKHTLAQLNPIKKKPEPMPEEKPPSTPATAAPAPAAQTAPAAAAPAEDAAKKAVELEIEKIQNGTSAPVTPMKPVTFRKRRGFTL